MQNSSLNIEQKGIRRQVSDNMVQVIYRRGRYHRISDSIYAWRLPRFESFGPQIRTGVRVIDQPYKNIASRDGVLHDITVHSKVFFDIRQAEPQLCPILAQNSGGIIRGRVSGIIDLILRKEFGDMTAAQIQLPGIKATIVSEIQKVITRELGAFGISPLNSVDGLYIKEVLAPDRLQDSRTEATSLTETVSSFNQLDLEELKQALMAHLLRDMGTKKIQFRSANMSEIVNPTSNAFLEGSYRVLREPTGRVYTN